MKVFIKHGTPVKEKVLNIYRHLATETFNNDPPSEPNAAYANFGTLRKVLYKVVESLKQAGSEHQLEFDNLLLISHYFAIRSAMQSIGGLETHIAKVSPHDIKNTGGLVVRPYFCLFIRPFFFFGGSKVAGYKTSFFSGDFVWGLITSPPVVLDY